MTGWRGISQVGLEQTGSPLKCHEIGSRFFLVLIPDEMNYEKLKAITELVIALSIDFQIRNVAARARYAELLLTLKVDIVAI